MTTRDGSEQSGGCIHEDIEKHFPELAHLIKWHLCSSDGPWGYIGNTLYYANDKDHNGLRRGEYSGYTTRVVSDAIKKSTGVVLYTSGEMYYNRQSNPNLQKSNEKDQAKIDEFVSDLLVPYTIEKVDSAYSLSEGKPTDLDAARRAAVWPEATQEQLLDEDALKARLPELMAKFREDVEAMGLVW